MNYGVDILMYHSVSDGAGPTCIAPATFARQMQAIEDAGCHVVALADMAGWLHGGFDPPPRTVALTFDDGYEDFANDAWPELRKRGWPATVFLPTAKVGRAADWDQVATGRRLMNWDTIAGVAEQGVAFGGHGVRHVDLTKLDAKSLHDEVAHPKALIAEHTGRRPAAFAAPFGRTNPAVRAEIARHYELAVGTRLGRASREADPFDLPRLEMWYFRDERRWRKYLTGDRTYFHVRRTLRWARSAVGLS